MYKKISGIVLVFLLFFAPSLNGQLLRKQRGPAYEHQATVNTPVYKQASGIIGEGYLGHPATLYARRINATGIVTVWINYTSNGRTYQADGPEATRLINLYKHNVLSRL